MFTDVSVIEALVLLKAQAAPLLGWEGWLRVSDSCRASVPNLRCSVDGESRC